VVTLGLVADIGLEEGVRGYLFDLSATGAYVILDSTREVGTGAAMSFRVGNGRRELLLVGRVARFVSLGARTGIGIAFERVDSDALRFIGELEAQTDAQRLASFQKIRKLRLTLRV
jgi:hypothetical protein